MLISCIHVDTIDDERDFADVCGLLLQNFFY